MQPSVLSYLFINGFLVPLCNFALLLSSFKYLLSLNLSIPIAKEPSRLLFVLSVDKIVMNNS